MRLLVCGNRDWPCIDTIAAWLRPFRKRGPVTVIHGAAKGADLLAGQVAKAMGYAVEEYPADWYPQRHWDEDAGTKRNQRMLEEGKPTRVLAFGELERPDKRRPGRLCSTGANDMVKRANRAGLLVTVVPRPGVLP